MILALSHDEAHCKADRKSESWLGLSDNPAFRKANKKDESWFKKHSDRKWHIRPFVEGEDGGQHDPPPAGMRPITIVEQLPSGGFMRRFLVSASPLSWVKHSDAAIQAIFTGWFLRIPKEDMVSIGWVPEDSPLAAQIEALTYDPEDPDALEKVTARVATLIDPWTASLGASL